MKSRLLLITCLAAFSAFGQTDEWQPDEFFVEVSYQSRNFVCIKTYDACWASASPAAGQNTSYQLFNIKQGIAVNLNSLIIPERRELLITLLNHKLSKHITELENMDENDDIIKTLKEIKLKDDVLYQLTINSYENDAGKIECHISYEGYYLGTYARSLEPYLVLNDDECKYFFQPKLFEWYDIK